MRVCNGCGKEYTLSQAWWHEKCSVTKESVSVTEEKVVHASIAVTEKSGATNAERQRKWRQAHRELHLVRQRLYRQALKAVEAAIACPWKPA